MSTHILRIVKANEGYPLEVIVEPLDRIRLVVRDEVEDDEAAICLYVNDYSLYVYLGTPCIDHVITDDAEIWMTEVTNMHKAAEYLVRLVENVHDTINAEGVIDFRRILLKLEDIDNGK